MSRRKLSYKQRLAITQLAHGGNKSSVARSIGVSRGTIYYWLGKSYFTDALKIYTDYIDDNPQIMMGLLAEALLED